MIPQRIVVTGAEGFVGRHMLSALRRAFPEAHVTAAVRQGAAGDARPVPADADRIVAFDLLSERSIVGLLEEARPDVCIHLAAFSDVGGSFADPDTAWAINVDGTRLLANCLLRMLPGCTMLYAGSSDIYGFTFLDGSVLDEHALLKPANPYSVSKAAADLALGELAIRGFRVIRMRPLNHVGPGQSERFAVASFARQIARIAAGLQPPVIQTGSLEPSREFLDVRDVCLAYVATLRVAESLPSGAIFNVSSEVPKSMASVLQDLLKVSALDRSVAVESSILRPVDIPSARCSSAALRAQTGWRPIYDWTTTLGDILGEWSGRVRETAA